MALEVPECFDDVAVAFSEEEWILLSKQEKNLYKEVMEHNYETMISVGYNIPLEQLLLLLKGHEEATHAKLQKDNLQDLSTICRYTESKENWIQHSLGRSRLCHTAKQMSEEQKGSHYPHCSPIQQKSQKEKRNCESSKCDTFVTVQERVAPHQQIYKVPFKCADCNRSFYKKCNLVMHRRIHWDTKPHNYAECNKTIEQKKLFEGCPLGYVVSRYDESKEKQRPPSSLGGSHLCHPTDQLSQGQRNHHDLYSTSIQQMSPKEEKSHEYSESSKSVSVQEGLTALHQLHKVPYKCADCNRSFYKKCNLVMHRRVHWGTKPREYVEHGKKVGQERLFVGYQLSHVGGKPYAYDECNTGLAFYNQIFIVKKQTK